MPCTLSNVYWYCIRAACIFLICNAVGIYVHLSSERISVAVLQGNIWSVIVEVQLMAQVKRQVIFKMIKIFCVILLHHSVSICNC